MNFSEVTLLFPVFHGGFRAHIIGPAAPFGNPGSRYFFDDLLNVVGCGKGKAGTGNIPDCTAADRSGFVMFIIL